MFYFLATCWASGEPHHSTFDGIHYSFHGNCEYVMSESTDGTFSITTKNVKCGYPAVTCTKDIIVYIFGNTINFVQGNTPTINGQEISNRGFTSAGISIKKTELFFSLFTNIGLTVQWDLGMFYFTFQ